MGVLAICITEYFTLKREKSRIGVVENGFLAGKYQYFC
jgi:hypothetical protein